MERMNKMDEEKWIAYLARDVSDECYLTCCVESRWEIAQKKYGAKTKLFVGAYDKVKEWYKARSKFAEVIKAWENGETIQIKNGGSHWNDIKEPGWCLKNEYRVKSEKKYRIAELEKRLETANKILKDLVAGIVLYSDDVFKAAKDAAEEFLKEEE